ncbi:hypothetical protein [Actinomadura hibisca]|uniref:hypothetical protein n=1 Tax=Actinomadura hibisca TaxID=68565 RepID=UPI0012F8AB89|nr:hypothetical protein [Actinomadura hibisca]
MITLRKRKWLHRNGEAVFFCWLVVLGRGLIEFFRGGGFGCALVNGVGSGRVFPVAAFDGCVVGGSGFLDLPDLLFPDLRHGVVVLRSWVLSFIA